MAYNLFDNIFDQFTKQAPSQVPNFATPIAPRTASYTTPTVTPTKQATPIKSKEFGVAPGFEGTVDQTARPINKFLQGGADLFTGIQKRLGETVQEDQTKFEQNIKKKQVDFANAMLAKGYAKPDIFKKLNELKAKGEFDFKPGISESIVGGVGERMKSLGETTQNLSQIQNPLERTLAGAIPFAGQTVASVTQPLVSAVEPFVSPVVKAIVEKTGQTQNIQDLSNQWSEFEKTNPILAENIAGALNVSQILPVPFAKPIAGAIEQGAKATGKALIKGAEKISVPISELRNSLAIKSAKKAQSLTDEGLKEIYEAVNPTTRENKAVLRKRVEDLLPYIDENKRFSNDLETVKSRVDADKSTAYKAMEDYETNVGVKGKVDTDSVSKAIADKYQEKIGDSFINADEAKIAQQLIDTLQGFGKTVDDANIIKIRRAWDKIIEKNKGFMQSAEATSKGDIFADANRFFRDEIKKSNPQYAKYLEKAHKTITLSDILDATIQRRTGQTQGGFIRKASENTARVIGTGLGTVVGGIPGAFVGAGATEALLAGVNKLTGSSTKLAKGKKLILKSQKNGTSTNNISNSRTPSVVGKSEQLTSGPRLKKPIVKPNTIKNESKVNKPISSDTIPEGYFKNAFGEIVKNPSNKKGGFIKVPTINGVRKLLETEGIGTYNKSSSVSGSAIRNVSESGDIKISKPLTRTRNGELITDKYVDNKGIIKVEKYINIEDRTKKLNNIMEILDKNGIPYRKLGFDLFTTPNEGQTISGIEFDLSKLSK